MKKKILIINGPNLNLTGMRDPQNYGRDTLAAINNLINERAFSLNIECSFFQSNSEGEIINAIHSCIDNYDGAIINAGAYTHYSYAIRDAISAVRKPFVEVHLSNIYARDEFRKHSVISPVCIGQISGFGKLSYIFALEALAIID